MRITPILSLLLLQPSFSALPPVPEWVTSLDTGKTHSSGTSAQISPDGTVLYITCDDGTLIAVDPDDGSRLWDMTLDGTAGYTSGASFSPDGSQFVYSVTDKGQATSRVVGMAHPSDDGEPLWISDPVEGVISGAPVFGTDSTYVYFTHNIAALGAFTALDVSGGGVPSVAFFQTASEAADVTLANPPASTMWSPVGIARSPSPDGNFRRGKGNSNDVLVWANLAVDGSSDLGGHTWAYQRPLDGAAPLNTTAVQTLGSSKWSTLTKPIFSTDGQDMFFTGSRSWFRGWTNGTQFNRGANVKVNPERGGPNPIRSALALSPDGETVFSATTSKKFSAIDVRDGLDDAVRIKWTTDALDANVEAGAKVTPDGMNVLLFTGSGRAHAYDTETGTELWQVPAPGEVPSGGVEAEFSLSPGGDVVYYVTINGILSAWRIADAQSRVQSTPSPTPGQDMAPTDAPATNTTGMPAAGSTPAPTQAPTALGNNASNAVPSGTPVPSEEEGTIAPSKADGTPSPTEADGTTQSPQEQTAPAPTASPVDDTAEPTRAPQGGITLPPVGGANPGETGPTNAPTDAPSDATDPASGAVSLLTGASVAMFWSAGTLLLL